GHGVPFFHEGDELLRSKSMDRSSVNSGDWFNRLDFTYTSNNWAVGLPPKDSNESDWPVMKPILADSANSASQAHILRAVAHFKDLLQIRKSSKLLRLGTGAGVNGRLRFPNTGPG